MLDFNTLTTGEIAKIEDLSGQSIRQFDSDTAPMGRALAAMAFVAKRRAGEPITWEQAQNLTLDEAQAAIGIEDEPDTDAPAEDDDSSAGEAADGPKSVPAKPATKRKK